MILQALAKLYDDLLKQEIIAPPGWIATKVEYAVCLDLSGNLFEIVPLIEETTDAKGNTRVIPQVKTLPEGKARQCNLLPHFLCDNASYFFGLDKRTEEEKKNGKKDRSKECFASSKALHLQILASLNNETANSLVRYFEKWNPEDCEKNPIIVQNRTNLCKATNLIFRINGRYVHEDQEISSAWQSHYFSESSYSTSAYCLVNGQIDTIERTHPVIKGVAGAQSSGAALVSFNAPAFCSYNREQGSNAPIGKKAAFAYTSALNHLLADRPNVQHIGDTTVVCWADGGEPQYRELALSCLFKMPSAEDDSFGENDLRAAMKRLAEGLPCSERQISPDKTFYILGLAPNAARLSVRFFWRSSFGELMKNVNEHHERMQIVSNKQAYVSLHSLLWSTANIKNSKTYAERESAVKPVLAGAVTRAIISGTRYPAALLENTMLRIRAERDITPTRAAIIKAYYLKNQDERCPKEVLTVGLNENSSNVPYTIGRLFAVYEAVQEQAYLSVNVKLNATIKDKYFNSVAATPAHILPRLNDLYRHHLKKLPQGSQVYFEKQVGELMNILGEEFPLRLSLPEQGAFQLGYYHQKQKRYEKKENK